MTDIAWGPTGQVVYERTYQRVKPDGTRETWPETVARVVRGNLELVYGPESQWSDKVRAEGDRLATLMREFRILPAGRHLWASGVKGRQHLFNCHVAGWGKTFSEHFSFTFLRLMEGGGVGANYSSRFLKPYGPPLHELRAHIVCDESHPDYAAMRDAGLLSKTYPADWDGAFEVADSREGWAAALTDLLDTYYRADVRHADRVFDVTNIRAAGARLKSFGGTASGPMPFARMMLRISAVMNDAAKPVRVFMGPDHLTPMDAMSIDHAIAECVVSGGNRRSARMSIVEWDDPFIYEFIACKRDTAHHWTTNISVGVDDNFLSLIAEDEQAVRRGTAEGDPHRESVVLAHSVHRAVVSGMLTNGEPGYWNKSLSQVGEVGEVVSTNPCGEIALEEWENCNLGHVNMQAFHDDWSGLIEAHRLMARFLIRATYGDVNDERQAGKLAANRRIGVGHFGVQGYLVKRGYRWTEPADFAYELEDLAHYVRRAARDYAFELRIPEPVKVTTVAPTGTIAKLAGVSEGIHPIYARYFIRRVRFSTVNPEERKAADNYRAQGLRVEPCLYAANTVVVEFPTRDPLIDEVEALGFDPDIVESADEISLDEMLSFQAMYQERYADNAVSFTANLPAEARNLREIAATIAKWLPKLKGTTIMPDGTRPQAPYKRITRSEYESLSGPKSVADSVDDECANGACPVR